jgi:hypothetical protein
MKSGIIGPRFAHVLLQQAKAGNRKPPSTKGEAPMVCKPIEASGVPQKQLEERMSGLYQSLKHCAIARCHS